MSWLLGRKAAAPAPAPAPAPARKGAALAAKYGFAGGGDDLPDMDMTDPEDDPELLAELEALSGEGGGGGGGGGGKKTGAKAGTAGGKKAAPAPRVVATEEEEEDEEEELPAKAAPAKVPAKGAPTKAPANAPAPAPAKAPAATKKGKDAGGPNLDLNAILSELGPTDIEHEVGEDDEDLNDPDLLNELAELGGNGVAEPETVAPTASTKEASDAPAQKKKKKASAEASPETPPKKKAAAEAAPEDPPKKAKKAATTPEPSSGDIVEPPPKQATRTQPPALVVQVAAVAGAAAAPAKPVQPDPLLTSTNIPELELAVDAAFKKAVELKEAGDLVGAKSTLVAIQPIKARLQQLQASKPVATPPPTKPAAAPAAKPTPAPAPAQAAAPATTLKPAAAAAAPGKGRVVLDEAAIVSASASTTLASSTVAKLDKESEEAYVRLETLLKAQIDESNRAKQMAHSHGDRDKTLAFHKDQRTFEQDLEVVRNARRRGDPVPAFHYEERSYERIISFPEIHEGHLEVTVLQGHSLPLPPGFKSLDTYVTIDVDHPKDAPQTATSPTMRQNLDPEYNFSHKFSITRGKALEIFLQKRSILVRVHYSLGFLRGHACLGRVNLAVDGLLKHCEVAKNAELTDDQAKGKVVGGRLEVRARLRMPFYPPEVRTETERWVFLDPPNLRAMTAPPSVVAAVPLPPTTPEAPLRVNPQATPAPAAPAASTAASPTTSAATTPATTPATPGSAKAGSPSPGKPGKASSGKIDEDDEDEDSWHQYNPDFMHSLEVMEDARGNLAKEIQQRKATKKGNVDFLESYLDSITFKIDMLQTSVATGSITPAAYRETLKAAVAEYRTRAIQFKAAGRADDVKLLLARMKMMESEIAQVDQMEAEAANEAA